MVELSDSAIGIIREAQVGKSLQYGVNDWGNYGWTTPQLAIRTQQTINMPILAKFSSLKGLFLTFQEKVTGAAQYYPFASSTFGKFNQYHFRIGSVISPAKAPYSLPEAFW